MVASCRGSSAPVQVEAANGEVSIACSPQSAGILRVEYGKFWAMGGSARVMADGSFQIPKSAAAVNAYLDQNSDGKFDRFVEPGAVCQFESSRWKCVIPNLRTIIHRAISMRNAELGDSTYVFLEHYDSKCSVVTQTSVCVADRCTQAQPSPFLSETGAFVKMLSLCGNEGFQPTDGLLKTADVVENVRVEQPVEIATPGIKMTKIGKSMKITLRGVDAHRILVWAGVSNTAGDLTKIYWHSEDPKVSIQRQGTTVVATVPPEFIELCQQDPECVLVAQLAKYDKHSPKLLTLTERRLTLDFR